MEDKNTNENNASAESFRYKYNAKEQSEIAKIRQKYTPQPQAEEGKLEKLHRLDRSVTRKAAVISLTLGVAGVLILGFGMSLIMTELGEYLGLSVSEGMWAGIIIGIIGCIPTSLAYPVHEHVVRSERKKLAPEILRLTDELLK